MTEAIEARGTTTPVSLRVATLVMYAAGLATYISTVGLPKQSWAAILWLWLLILAWDVRRPLLSHLAFLRDWWPVLAALTVYLYSRGISDDLGFVNVHFIEPIDADRWLFGGTLPTEWLQANLCGVPCERASQPAWYDVALTTVYYTHFFAALSIAAFLWVRNRPEWIRYMRRYLSLTFLALAIYITYPMAPPWMASRDGLITEDISRITGRGWFDFGRSGGSTAHQSVSAVGNQVAAMPSLHAGLAILVAAYLISRLRGTWRWLLVLYPVAMSFMLVYYAEHYVVDIIAGGICVAAVIVGWTVSERRRGGHSESRAEADPDDVPEMSLR